MAAVILENIRSAFNVGNIVRTADAFGFDVIISGYTPSPFQKTRIYKSSLGAEKYVNIKEFWNTTKAINYAKEKYSSIISAEITKNSKDLKYFETYINHKDIAIVFGNEVSGVLDETLKNSDYIFHIPMTGKKESLNVGQSSAIFMWEYFRKFC